MTIRRATENDIDFLITAIIEAEKSGSDIISYCAIFGISEAEFRSFLKSVFEEEVEGQEFYIANFLIAEIEGKSAATLSAWVEHETGVSSNMIKSNLFMYFIDREKVLNAGPNIQLMNEAGIPRESHALQIECVYTAPPFRGQGLTYQLIDEQIRLHRENGSTFNKVQIILLKNNEKAIRAYEKAGFTIAAEKKATNEAIFQLLPCDTKIIMEKNIQN